MSHIGPFCHVGPEVVIGDGTRLISHVVIDRRDDDRQRLHRSIRRPCSVDRRKAPATRAGARRWTIGDNCIIREYVSINIGTDCRRGTTTIGNNGIFLAYVHIAHDCAIGNNVTMTNGATLAGHCEIGDFVGIGGLSAVHQFMRIGHNAFIAGGSMILGDVIPYAIVGGNRATLRGMNVVGMKRSGISHSEMLKLRRAYKMIFDRSRPLAENIETARVNLPIPPMR